MLPEYVESMYLMMQQEEAEDFVIATGVTTEIREMLQIAFNEVGIQLAFTGKGENEKAVVEKCINPKYQLESGKIVVEVDKNYFRPTEVELLIGDPTKAKEKLGWVPEYDLQALVKEMIENDIKQSEKEVHLRNGGYNTLNYYE